MKTFTGGATLDLIKAAEAFLPWEAIGVFVYQFHYLRSVLCIGSLVRRGQNGLQTQYSD